MLSILHFMGDIPAQRDVGSQLIKAEFREGRVGFLSPRAWQSPVVLMGPGEGQQEAGCMSPNPGDPSPRQSPRQSDKGYNFSSCGLQGGGKRVTAHELWVTKCLVTLGVRMRGT